MKRFVLLLLTFIFLTSSVNAQEKSLYLSVDAGTDMLDSYKKSMDFFDFTSNRSFNKVCWYLNNTDYYDYLNQNIQARRAILNELHTRHIQVECVIDFTDFIDSSAHNNGLTYIDTVLSFQDSASQQGETFRTIQLIAHPEVIIANTPDGLDKTAYAQKVWADYVGFLQKVRSRIDNHNNTSAYNIKYSIAFSTSYDTDNYPVTNYISITDIADRVTFYPMTNSLYFAKNNCSNEAQYAQTTGKPFNIAFIAKLYPKKPSASFWGTTSDPENFMNQVLYTGIRNANDESSDKISVTEFFSAYSLFKGIAIESYEKDASLGYQELTDSYNTSDGSFQTGQGGNELDMTAYDYENFMPGFMVFSNSKTDSALISIDLTTTQRHYGMLIDNDSDPNYELIIENMVVKQNNQDDIMEPLEKGSLIISIDTSLIHPGLAQNLKAKVETSYPIILTDNSPDIVYGIPTLLNFFVGEIPKNLRYKQIPISIRLYNTEQSSMIYSQEIPLYLTMNDTPAGQLLSVTSPDPGGVIPENDTVEIISGENMHVTGWVFDDDENFEDASSSAISLVFNTETAPDNDDQYSTTTYNSLTKDIFEYNITLGTNDPLPANGFEIECSTDNLRRYFYLKTKLEDQFFNDCDGHIVYTNYKQVYWNKKPTNAEIVSINGNQNYEQAHFYVNELDIKVSATDPDIEQALGAHLSKLEIFVNDVSMISVNIEMTNDIFNVTWDNDTFILDNESYQLTNISYSFSKDQFDNDTIEFNFTWPGLGSIQNASPHVLRVKATDSYTLENDSVPATFYIYNNVPDIQNIIPKLGTWKGGNIVSITGIRLLYADTVTIRNAVSMTEQEATIKTQTDSLLEIQLPEFLESAYVDIELANSEGSDTLEEGYRFISSKTSTSIPVPSGHPVITPSDILDIKYNSWNANVYILTSSSVICYDDNDGTVTSPTAINTTGTPIAMDFSREKTLTDNSGIFVIKQGPTSTVNMYLDNNGTLENDGTISFTSDIYPSSLAYMMYDKILVGSKETDNSNLYITYLNRDNDSYTTLTPVNLPSDRYDSVDVYPSANKFTAYILCKDDDTDTVDIYRYDSKNDRIKTADPYSHTPKLVLLFSENNNQDESYELLIDQLDEIKLSVNYDGSEWIFYSKSSIVSLDKNGLMKNETTAIGSDLVKYDSSRKILYGFNVYYGASDTETDNDTHFQILSSKTLEQITYCQYPPMNPATTPYEFFLGKVSLDIIGEQMFAVTTAGINSVQLWEIYPEIEEIIPNAYENKVELVVANAGRYLSTKIIDIYDNNDNLLTPTYMSYDSDNDTHKVIIPMDNDAKAITIYSKLYDYPSKYHIVTMQKTLNIIAINKVYDWIELIWVASSGINYKLYWSNDIMTWDPADGNALHAIDDNPDGTKSWIDYGTDPEMGNQSPADIDKRFYKLESDND